MLFVGIKTQLYVEGQNVLTCLQHVRMIVFLQLSLPGKNI